MSAPSQTSALAHDIRNILTPALLSVERLTGASSQDRSKLITRIFTSIDKTVALCQETMDKGSSKTERAVERCSVSSFIAEAAQLAIPNPDDDLDLFVNISGEDRIVIDRNAVMRMVFNLVRNAANALKGSRGKIVINAVASDGKLVIDVIDNGPGLPDHVLDLLFPSLIKKAAQKRRIGLGLPSSVHAARTLGGELVLQSTSEKGTHFSIDLPCPSTNFVVSRSFDHQIEQLRSAVAHQ